MATERRRVEPQRTCVVCRRSAAKGTFHRIVRSSTGDVRYDPTGRAPGRGAYLCGRPGCLEPAAKGRRLQRALRGADPEEVRRAVEAVRTTMESGSMIGASAMD
ncbi:MAG TPA: YlxR family protein [Actinomycetes bacterium]|jgi:predicted RNA-binding protein YlxR (DUF448 family)|nr:YlxR family protein [Actinomycetes bacterium]